MTSSVSGSSFELKNFVLKNKERVFSLRTYEQKGSGRENAKRKADELDGLPLLAFESLSREAWIRHCFTTRAGGVSRGIFRSLNLSYTRGDDPKAVTENYRRVARAMGTDLAHIVTSDQTHTTNIRLVTAEDAGKGITRERDYRDTDGLITDVPGLLLATFYADCVPLYLIDPVHRAIGLSHSGWRGTLGRMGAKTVRVMGEAYGSRPQDMLAAIGPSICRDCYEVSRDLAESFTEEFGPGVADFTDQEHGQLDLWECNRRVFSDAGLSSDRIIVGNLCTCCNSDKLFSHRASHGRRGNLGAFLMITPRVIDR